MSADRANVRFWKDVCVRSVKLLNIFLICAPFAYIWLTYYSKQVYGGEFSTAGTYGLIAAYIILYSLFVRIYDAFQVSQVSRSELFISQLIAITLTDTVFIMLLIALLRDIPEMLRVSVVFLAQVFISIIWCLIVSWWYFRVFKKRRAVIIYDSVHNLNEIAEHSQFKKSFDLTGAYDIDEIKSAEDGERIRWLIDKIRDTEVVFIMEIPDNERNVVVKYCVENEISCYSEPTIGDILFRGSKQFNMYNLPMCLIEKYNPTPEYMIIKRLTDIILSLLTLIVTSPILFITALAIKISDGGPVIYKQKRLTKNGRVFDIYKFRSMKTGAENDTGAVLSTGPDDPRVTGIGRLIRKLRIDEFPQLINIIKGDMSIVGPRPERPEIAKQYSEVLPEFHLRLQVRAGLTGYAQVYGRYDSDPYDKLCMDLHYISRAGFTEDLRIMLVTVKRIIAKEPEGVREDEHDRI